jgi:hypothetical protein
MSQGSIAFDALLDICRNQHRRIVLGVLTGEQRSVTLTDLTMAILKYNHQTPIADASEEIRREIRLSLYHVHLPKLASEGFINYCPEHQLVEPTEKLKEAQPTLSTILDADPSLETPIEL